VNVIGFAGSGMQGEYSIPYLGKTGLKFELHGKVTRRAKQKQIAKGGRKWKVRVEEKVVHQLKSGE